MCNKKENSGKSKREKQSHQPSRMAPHDPLHEILRAGDRHAVAQGPGNTVQISDLVPLVHRESGRLGDEGLHLHIGGRHESAGDVAQV